MPFYPMHFLFSPYVITISLGFVICHTGFKIAEITLIWYEHQQFTLHFPQNSFLSHFLWFRKWIVFSLCRFNPFAYVPWSISQTIIHHLHLYLQSLHIHEHTPNSDNTCIFFKHFLKSHLLSEIYLDYQFKISISLCSIFLLPAFFSLTFISNAYIHNLIFLI